MKRRNFLTGLVAAPAVILTPGLLMPVKAIDWGYPTHKGAYDDHVYLQHIELDSIKELDHYTNVPDGQVAYVAAHDFCRVVPMYLRHRGEWIPV